MAETLRMVFLVFMWAGMLAMQYNHELDTTSTRKLKDALELAIHDAALEIDKAEMSEGNIVFKQVKAEENFRKSLQENLSLNTSLQPESSSFFQEKVEIKYVEYIDDSNTVTYPFNYFNDKYEIYDTVNGPAIVAVIETKGPRYFAGPTTTIRQAVVYEYKDLQ
jgi:hypothetical protein